MHLQKNSRQMVKFSQRDSLKKAKAYRITMQKVSNVYLAVY